MVAGGARLGEALRLEPGRDPRFASVRVGELAGGLADALAADGHQDGKHQNRHAKHQDAGDGAIEQVGQAEAVRVSRMAGANGGKAENDRQAEGHEFIFCGKMHLR